MRNLKKRLGALISAFLLCGIFAVSSQAVNVTCTDCGHRFNCEIGIDGQARFKPRASASVIIERDFEGSRQVLLQLRKNTGWMDSMWDFGACGHLDEGETLLSAALRETKEELGVAATGEDMEFVFLGSNFVESKGIYCCTYFKLKNFTGKLKVGEPEFCEEIKWFDVNNLPENMVPMQRFALENYIEGAFYGEFGWEKYSRKNDLGLCSR